MTQFKVKVLTDRNENQSITVTAHTPSQAASLVRMKLHAMGVGIFKVLTTKLIKDAADV